jgi:predicted nucleic-acid-binding Zn-ribbon protein
MSDREKKRFVFEFELEKCDLTQPCPECRTDIPIWVGELSNPFVGSGLKIFSKTCPQCGWSENYFSQSHHYVLKPDYGFLGARPIESPPEPVKP